jgi:hypothetical protein
LLTPRGEQNIIAFPHGKAKHYWFLICQLAKQDFMIFIKYNFILFLLTPLAKQDCFLL